MKKKTKKVNLDGKRYVVVRPPTGGEVTKAQDMRAYIDENITDMEEHADGIAELSYKSISWCILEHNLMNEDGKQDLWRVLMDSPATEIRKIQDAIESLTGGGVEKKR